VGNQCLNDLALQGGINRTTTPYYYAASNLQNNDLRSALASIADQVVCHLELSNNPPQFDPDRVDLLVGSNVIPRDTSGGSPSRDAGDASGWSFDRGTSNDITVVGPACQALVSMVLNQTADLSKVQLNICPMFSH
jgi:hypothetical protein